MAVISAYALPHPPLLVPQVGKGKEAAVQQTAASYATVMAEVAAAQPDTIVVITPHSVSYSDYIHISPKDTASGSFDTFGAREVSFAVSYDTAFVAELQRIADNADLPMGTLGGEGARNAALDHGFLVPIHALSQRIDISAVKFARISISGLNRAAHYRAGQAIAAAAEKLNRRVVIFASGDLSHKLAEDGPYGFDPAGLEFDEKICAAFKQANFADLLNLDDKLCQAAAECGLRSFIMMEGVLDGKAVSPRLLSYQAPFGVGYAVASFDVTGHDDSRRYLAAYEKEQQSKLDTIRQNESAYARLARQTLENHLQGKPLSEPPPDLPADMLSKQAGVFVCIKKDGQLRGCIGTISPTRSSIAAEIMTNAISAATADHRFNPVEAAELPHLTYTIDILGESEPIQDESQLDPTRYGVIVTAKGKRGLLLPNLDGIDTSKQQVDVAMQKGGIRAGESVKLERFIVERYT